MQNEKLKRKGYEKDSIIKAFPDKAASIDESEWQAEHWKSKYISNQTKEPVKTINSFLLLQKIGCRKSSSRKYWTPTKVKKSKKMNLIPSINKSKP